MSHCSNIFFTSINVGDASLGRWSLECLGELNLVAYMYKNEFVMNMNLSDIHSIFFFFKRSLLMALVHR